MPNELVWQGGETRKLMVGAVTTARVAREDPKVCVGP